MSYLILYDCISLVFIEMKLREWVREWMRVSENTILANKSLLSFSMLLAIRMQRLGVKARIDDEFWQAGIISWKKQKQSNCRYVGELTSQGAGCRLFWFPHASRPKNALSITHTLHSWQYSIDRQINTHGNVLLDGYLLLR